MPKVVSFNGTLIRRPGAYSKTQDGAMTGLTAVETKVVGVVATCAGGVPGGSSVGVNIFTNPRTLADTLVSGDAYDAARFAFDPTQGEAGGAAKVIVSRVNSATQATGTITNAAAAALLTLTTNGYGLKYNGVEYDLDASTYGGATGPGVKFRERFEGSTLEYDNIGCQPAILVQYVDAVVATCTASLSSTAFTTTTAGNVDDLNLSLTTYDTVQKLVDAINATASGDYTATAITSSPNTTDPADLDYFTTVDIKQPAAVSTVNGAHSATATSLTMFSDAAYAAGDVIINAAAGTEYIYVTDKPGANVLTVIRGYANTTAVAYLGGETMNVHYPMMQEVIALRDKINSDSALFTAAREATLNVGVPTSPTTFTYVSGGGDGSTGATQWQNALQMLRQYRCSHIVVADATAVNHGYLATHCAWGWSTAGKSERLGYSGCAANETKTQQLNRGVALNDRNIILAASQEIQRENDAGTSTWYAPWALAAHAAGIMAGLPAGTPLAWKQLKITGLRQASSWSPFNDFDDLFDGGLLVAEEINGKFRFIRGVTTYLEQDNRFRQAPCVRNAGAQTVYYVRTQVENRLVGVRHIAGQEATVRNIAKEALEYCRDVEGWIVAGSERDNEGNVTAKPAFENIQVTITSNVIALEYKAYPADGTEIITITETFGPLTFAG